MTRHKLLFLVAIVLFGVAIWMDHMNRAWGMSSTGWVAGGLIAYTLTELFIDKPL